MDSIELGQLVSHLRAIGNDTQSVEVKAAAGGLPSTMAETVSAFANGSGGTVILGLAEKDGFAPAEKFKARDMHDALASLCSDKLTPPVRASISVLPFEGSQVVVAEVSELAPSSKPCYVTSRGMYGGSFIRTGDGDRKLTEYEIDRLVEERTQPRHDLEPVEGATVADLSPALLAGVLSRQRELHPRIFGNLSDNEAMDALNITATLPDGGTGVTLAGLLALGTYPQHFFPRLTVQFASYQGTEKASGEVKFLDSETMAGPIPAVIMDTMAAVRRNTRVGGTLEGGLRRDVPDLPPDAVREAVCNALMHRDYSPMGRGSAVQVDLYPDRLEVLSPGGLYGTVTVDMLGRVGASSTRNQHLSALLETTPWDGGGYVAENRGTGYALIRSELAKAGLSEPVATDRPSLFTLELHRKTGANLAAQLANGELSPSIGSLPMSVPTVYAALAKMGSARTSDLIRETSLSRGTVVKALGILADQGMISSIGGSKNSPTRTYRAT